MAERVSDARSYNLFPSYPVVCFETREMESEGEEKRKRTKETNGPIFFLKRCFSSSFIKSRRRIPFDWLITRSIHHWPTYPLQFDTAILDNLLRMTKRSLLPWLLFDLFNIRKLIFYLKQMYQVLSHHLDEFCTLKSLLMPSYSPTVPTPFLSLSVVLSLFNGQICVMCEAEGLCVCVFVCISCLFLLSLCALKCPLVSANHF